MNSRQRLMLVVGIVVLGVLGFAWTAAQTGIKFANQIQASELARAAKTKAAEQMPVKQGHLFTNAQVYTFLAAAKQAELTTDPLQRCLVYPDPPGSHWSPAAVRAYCHYRMQAIMSFADMQGLIQNGKAAELDQRMAAMLHAQQTDPDARGLLDRTFDLAFDGSFDERSTLDAWKRDSPKSAFAYAASGFAYQKMAHAARGDGFINQTPASALEAMNRLLQQADTDLQQAVALDPKIMPAYVAMIDVGGHGFGDNYAENAARRALLADPANFSIYDAMLWDAQPKWGGSIPAMTTIIARAQKHASENPLLTLLQAKASAYGKLDHCDCHTADELATYPTIFDEVGTAQQLLSAGYAAEASHHLELAVVYFSEAMRFDPDLPDERLHRIYDLNNFDESQWAVDEATTMMRASPTDEDPIKARGYSYLMLNDMPHAEKDMLAALALEPGDGQELTDLQSLYIDSSQWDKAWVTNNRLVQSYPNEAYDWRMRALIQQKQPRAGLQKTVDYFAAHFDSTPGDHEDLLKMRAALALQPRSLR